jgi:predicted nucleotidyltransferase
MDISEIIKKLNQQISSKYNDFQGSYLYGSRVNGSCKDDSDIDIVTIFDNLNREKELEICGIVGEIEYTYNVFIDIQTYTLQQLKKNPFYYREVAEKGVFYGI